MTGMPLTEKDTERGVIGITVIESTEMPNAAIEISTCTIMNISTRTGAVTTTLATVVMDTTMAGMGTMMAVMGTTVAGMGMMTAVMDMMRWI